ncbi:hypothetical protein [Synechococcus sp. GFB01]|uniref:hypothetical protein n=1 Tax=Synechococcus sp. GFB01 TaxID=1662190 RepID=UPI00090814E3|nr:hypothetical protein [Synechococcus sp. GFB01]
MAEIDPVDDPHAGFASLLPMQAAGVLLQRALPGHGHRQQQGVERRVIEAFAHQPPGGQHDAGCLRGQLLQRGQSGAALACAQAAMQEKQLRHLLSQRAGDRCDVVRALA